MALVSACALLAGVCLLAPLCADAQTVSPPPGGYALKVWTTREGLPQNMVRALVQTRDGYLWIGTSNAGLVRFDGVAFTTFDISNTPGFPSNWVSTLREDAEGTLWIGTGAGLARYRGGAFTFEDFGDDLAHGVVSAIEIDRDGHVWVATDGQIARRDGARWTRVPLADARAQSLLLDRDGTAWIGTADGLIEWRDHIVRRLTTRDGLPGEAVRALHQDQDGQIWVGTNHGVARLDRARGTAAAESGALARVPVLSLFEDHEGVLWIGSAGSLFTRTRDRQVVEHRIAEVAEGSQIAAVIEDREGHLWVGVEGGRGGLHRLTRQRVSVLAHEQGLPCDTVAPLTESADGTLWAGVLCGDGRGIVSIRDGRLETFDQPAYVASLLAEPDGAVWAGTLSGELYRLERGRFAPQRVDAGGPLGAVLAIHRDEAGALWLGTSHGLARLANGAWTMLRAADGLADDSVRSIAAGRDGSLWIGTGLGLSHYADGRLTTYTAADGLPRAAVRAVHVDADGVVWLGTFGGGLARLKDGKVTPFGTQAGLLDSAIHRILEDDAGYLWMSGDRGIRRVKRWELNEVAEGRLAAPDVVIYDEADGMKTAESSGAGQPAGWRMRDGSLRFPTQGGIVRIDPRQVSTDPLSAPSPLIEAATINGTPYSVDASLTAPPGSTDLQVRYTAPAFARPEQVQFRYRLDGYDTAWVEAGGRRVAQYTNLAPGTYRFHLAARSGGGKWSEQEAAVALVLQPRLYQRLSFRVGMALLAALLGLVIVRASVMHLRRRAQALEAIVVERTAELARQRDEVAMAHDRLASAKQNVEAAHGQVLAVLSQLDLGVLVLDAAGAIRYLSEPARKLLGDDDAPAIGQAWTARLPLVAADRAQLVARIESPSPLGARLPVQMQLGDKRYWMEIDVRNEPPPGTGRILYLYNVSEVSEIRTRDPKTGPHELVGQSTVMHVLYKQIRDAAKGDVTVLIEGETGSGKELVARAIHRGSPRASRPFVAVNAAGLAESLLASQLFGHRRGAFTGAVADQVGLFEAANGGTLFLDEIGDIPASVQVSLLRVLQEHEITRLGDSRARKLDVRFLAATHRDLSREVAEGRFRQDLLYRVRVLTIRVPPLRDRRDDLPLLVQALLAQAAAGHGDRAMPEISREVMAALARHNWPGNVRELKSVIEQTLLSCTGRVLRVDDLPDTLAHAAGAPSPAAEAESERERLLDALRRSRGNRSEAARLLRIGRATLYRKLASHGLAADS